MRTAEKILLVVVNILFWIACIATAMVIASGCANVPAHDCMNPSGLMVVGAHNCEAFAQAEDDALRRLTNVLTCGPDKQCEMGPWTDKTHTKAALRGWLVQVQDDFIHVQMGGQDVIALGRTLPGLGIIQLTRFDDWGTSALSHEIAHVLEFTYGTGNPYSSREPDCTATQYNSARCDKSHPWWYARKIFALTDYVDKIGAMQ